MGKNGQGGSGQPDAPKKGILARLNLDPWREPEGEKTAALETAKTDKYATHRDDFGRFGPGNPGGGRKPGVKSLRQMVKEKGQVVVEADAQKRTFAQLLVDRLWMNAVAGSERAINMVIDSVDGPLLPPEPEEKPIKVYKVDFHGTTIINRRDEVAEDELIRKAEFIDIPMPGEGGES